MERLDVAVVGGGVVGLAVACAISERGRSTCLLERHPRMGLEASTHNSGVIHAGIYYPEESLKARLCVEGRDALYAFCTRNDIPHTRCGKLIVCSDATEIPVLEELAKRGRANGVEDLCIVNTQFIKTHEPSIRACAALWSPSTGIVEAETLVRKLTQLATAQDVFLLTGTAVLNGIAGSDGIELQTSRERIFARTVVNAAGLYADDLSAMLGGETFTIYPVRGEYAELSPKAQKLVNGLIYPLPDRSGHGLGVHLTKTTWGTVTIGPTAHYQSVKNDYEGNRLKLESFYDSVLPLLPNLNIDDLRLGGTGIRAKLCPEHVPFEDFMLRRDTRVPCLIHAAGIDSPGLTACLAIGKEVSKLVEETLT